MMRLELLTVVIAFHLWSCPGEKIAKAPALICLLPAFKATHCSVLMLIFLRRSFEYHF